MPLIQVFTSATPDSAAADKLLRDLSAALAEHFDKPEQWVMTCLLPGLGMTFGGASGPTCFAAVKNIGKLTPAKTAKLSADLSFATLGRPGRAVESHLPRVHRGRGHLWGYDGGTFG